MFASFPGLFGAWLVFLVGMCKAENIQASGSSLSPFSIIYTIYPYYNSEANLLRIVKSASEQPLKSVLEGNFGASADTTTDGKNTTPNEEPIYSTHSSESTHHRRAESQLTEITYWPPVQRGAVPKSRLGRTATTRQQTDSN